MRSGPSVDMRQLLRPNTLLLCLRTQGVLQVRAYCGERVMSDKTTQSIRPCTCKSEFQDARYGSANRVFNRMNPSGKKQVNWRCTSCGREQA